MSRKIMLVFLTLGLAFAVGCKSELDNKAAATVSEAAAPLEEEAEAESDNEDSATLRELAVNQSASKIEWLGAKVTGDHTGGFNTWSGTATVDENNAVKAVNFEVDVTSVFSDNDRLTEHLKSDDFFDVENHPKSTFTSTAISEGAEGVEGATHTVTGNLSLRGVTKELSFPAAITAEDDKVVAAADFKFKRFDFNIAYKGQADDLIRDEVALTLRFEVPLNEEAPALAGE